MATAAATTALVLLCMALAGAWPAHSQEGEECVSGHRKANAAGPEGCGGSGSCYCLGGRWVCPEAECGGGDTGGDTGGPGVVQEQPRAGEPPPLSLRRSKRVPLDGERCAPGVTYMDECNTCICSQDGIKAHASCTFKVCPK